MKLPYSWLKELVPFQLTPEDLADQLTMLGLEVEGVEDHLPSFKGVVVGEVLSTEKHPDADKLTVAQVTDGAQEFQVVCGAANCRPGIRVAFAKVGARLDDGSGGVFKIKKSKIRGVESLGMLCAENELGLAEESDGIMELGQELALGSDLATPYRETVLEVALTPNLAHCNSILGVAREVAALVEASVTLPKPQLKEDSSIRIEEQTSVTIDAKEACPRYACRMIRGIKVGPSPDWLKRKVEACGMRSINNVVDITNFVLMEQGHPLHAFDYDQLKGGRIHVRLANAGESFVTLDGEQRTLTNEMLMICDAEQAVAIAGVMGGENSEVSEQTTNVLLESAYFDPTSTRRTAKKLNLMTEASRRFEQGCDPERVLSALDRAAGLIQEVAGGDIVSGVIDEGLQEFPRKEVACRHSRVNQLLGTELSVSEVEDIFRRLELAFTYDNEDQFTVQVPSYRHDINIEVDLIEEVARLFGYDNIPRRQLRYTPSPLPHAPIYLLERETRRRLAREGLQELLTCDLIGPSLIQKMDASVYGEDLLIHVKNPTSLEQSILRPSFLPGLLQVAKHNIDHQNKDLLGYEVGHIHLRSDGDFKEQSVAAILLTGHVQPQNWDRTQREVDFFDLKGTVENLLEGLRVEEYAFEKSTSPLLHPGRQAVIRVGETAIGTIGEVHPAVLRRMDIGQRVFYGEINLHELFSLRRTDIKLAPLSIYPGSERDWTLTVEEAVSAEELFASIRSCPSRLLQDVSLISVYRSEKIGADRKNVTFNLMYRSEKKTLEQAAVDKEHARIVSHVQNELGKRVLA